MLFIKIELGINIFELKLKCVEYCSYYRKFLEKNIWILKIKFMSKNYV